MVKRQAVTSWHFCTDLYGTASKAATWKLCKAELGEPFDILLVDVPKLAFLLTPGLSIFTCTAEVA